MNYQYSIEIGDWSKDGHNQSDTYIFNTTHKKEDILKAYKKAVKITKVDLDVVCSEYEDNELRLNDCKALEKIGVDLSNYDGTWDTGEDKDGEGKSMASDTFADLFMRMVATQLKDFEYKLVEPECIMRGIGYGLFH